ncbi:unnamed protein product [Bursaphelenchus xylophilus]|uniref:(pine wood nematode) hypothetical protein n=1 Tax=Bursaphelenchus xylophilus TaxID=6326 RepID=A0A1I7RHF5_BURXY|nr:unnamed protein product [Bursaphelenchus xylophilus]CAG9115790.1 unnamed protein product [Bursaphelenchus xylophilus]
MAIREEEEKKHGLSETPQDTSALPDELPSMVPYIKNLQERIGKLTDVITQKQQLLDETAQKLEASNSLSNSFQQFESEVGEYISVLLDKTYLSEENELTDGLRELLKNDHTDNMTKLLMACKNGELEKVKEFHNEDFESKKIWADALFLAFQNAHLELVDYILETKGENLTLNLQEYCYYFSQLKEKGVINKCRTALKAIINAPIAGD